jgi:hypothetical protein
VKLTLIDPVLDPLVLFQSVLVFVGGVTDEAPGRPVVGGVGVSVVPAGVGEVSELALADGALAPALGFLENALET